MNIVMQVVESWKHSVTLDPLGRMPCGGKEYLDKWDYFDHGSPGCMWCFHAVGNGGECLESLPKRYER